MNEKVKKKKVRIHKKFCPIKIVYSTNHDLEEYMKINGLLRPNKHSIYSRTPSLVPITSKACIKFCFIHDINCSEKYQIEYPIEK